MKQMQNLGLKVGVDPYSGKNSKRRRSASSIGGRSKSSPKKTQKLPAKSFDKKDILKL